MSTTITTPAPDSAHGEQHRLTLPVTLAIAALLIVLTLSYRKR